MRKLTQLVAFSALGAMILAISVATAAAADTKLPTISEIMKKGHGAKGPLAAIGAAAKSGKWDDVKTDAELIKAFGEALGQSKPSKGDEASWKKLTDAYKTQTSALAAAVDKKDAKAATAAIASIKGSCGSCHKAHK